MNRITPIKILKLKQNEVYVFGSNLASIHGKGSAKYAADNFGAKKGVSFGLSGQSFAIPTKDKKIKTLEIVQIKYFVNRFIDYAKSHPDLVFYVVEIGCLNAGYTPSDIAPLFKDAIPVDNIWLPKTFWDVLLHHNEEQQPIGWTGEQKPSTEYTSLFSKWKDENPKEKVIDHFISLNKEDNGSIVFPSLKDDPKPDDYDNGSIKHFQD